jgi:hypothetical protein
MGFESSSDIHKLTTPAMSVLDEDWYHLYAYTYEGRVSQTFGIPLLQRLRQVMTTGVIVDAGACTGQTTRELQRIFPEHTVIGLEKRSELYGRYGQIVQAQLADLNQPIPEEFPEMTKKPSFVVGDYFFPPFKANSVQAVFIMNSLTNSLVSQLHQAANRSEKEKQTVICELEESIKRLIFMLRPGGFVCISSMTKRTNPYVVIKLDEQKRGQLFSYQFAKPQRDAYAEASNEALMMIYQSFNVY